MSLALLSTTAAAAASAVNGTAAIDPTSVCHLMLINDTFGVVEVSFGLCFLFQVHLLLFLVCGTMSTLALSGCVFIVARNACFRTDEYYVAHSELSRYFVVCFCFAISFELCFVFILGYASFHLLRFCCCCCSCFRDRQAAKVNCIAFTVKWGADPAVLEKDAECSVCLEPMELAQPMESATPVEDRRCCLVRCLFPASGVPPVAPLPPLRTTLCGHTFHRVCIEGCVERGQSCPLCRRRLLQAGGLGAVV